MTSRRDFLDLERRIDASPGAVRAMALKILMEWRLAETSGAFRTWLEAGAPSADREARSA
jgi:hypothetical protein